MLAIIAYYGFLQLLFAALASLITLPWMTSGLTNTFNWTTCETRDSVLCNCSSTVLIDVIARCRFDHVTQLKLIIVTRKDALRLDLSWNNIQGIPGHSFQNYFNLIYLSLFCNKIRTISEGAFTGLTRLRELNLQDNLIKQWDTTLIEKDLPNLIMLNVAQNIYWKPDQPILSLPNLRIIYLLLARNWNLYNCYVIRRNSSNTPENYSIVGNIPSNFEDEVTPDVLLRSMSYGCWSQEFYFRDASYWDVIEENGMYFHCAIAKSSQLPIRQPMRASSDHYQQHAWFFIRHATIQYCWNMMQNIHIITLMEGICAMVLNLIVIITTLRSRVLRESVAHVLVANIAVGDLLVSLYMVIITSTRQMLHSTEYHDLYLPYYCRIVGLFFLIGQFSSPFMSFIMTLERYLAVVYCMRPHIRITSRMTNVAMAIFWGLSLSLAVSFMTSPKFSRTPESMCVPLTNINGQQVLNYIGGAGVVLYIVAMALYTHMYVDFQKTNQKTVQLQRENRLARRIALIMFTNVLFFIIPLITTYIFNLFAKQISLSRRQIFWRTFAIICLGINYSLNPILFSFRNEQFRNELRRHFRFIFQNSVAVQP